MRRSIGWGLAALIILALVLVLRRVLQRDSDGHGARPPAPVEATLASELTPAGETLVRIPVPESESAPVVVPDPELAQQQPAARIEGRVVMSDGVSPAAGVLVLAKREDAHWNAQSLRSAGLEVQGLDRALSDATGEFTIELSAPAAVHDLIAGGRGHVCKDVVRGVRAGDRAILVQVERAYALWLRIREVGGATPRIPGDLYGTRYGTAKPLQTGPRMLQGSAQQLALALSGESPAPSSMFDRLYACLAPSAETETGPVQLRLDWPGYEPAELTFMVPAIDGPIAEQTLELRPLSECSAPVRVSWLGVPPELPVGNSPEPSALLRFESEIAGSFDVAIRTFSPGPTALAELPCGAYRVWWTRGSLPVRGVPEGEPTHMQLGLDGYTLSFDLSHQGWVRLDFALPDGQLHGGSASILLGPGSVSEGLAGESRMFSGPPFVFGPLDPGVCYAYLDQPRMGDRTAGAARAAAVQFEVLPGVVSAATSRLAGSR